MPVLNSWHSVEQLMGVVALLHGGQLQVVAEVEGGGCGRGGCLVCVVHVSLELLQKLLHAEACSARLRAAGSRTPPLPRAHAWVDSAKNVVPSSSRQRQGSGGCGARNLGGGQRQTPAVAVASGKAGDGRTAGGLLHPSGKKHQWPGRGACLNIRSHRLGRRRQGRAELDLPRPAQCLLSAGAPYFLFACAVRGTTKR